MTTINERVAMVVANSKLTKTAFAAKLSVSTAHISKICSGEGNLSDRTIKDICREFDINENWLRYGVGEMEVEISQKQKLTRFFADVLATAPDDRSAFISALDDLPPEFWPLVVELAKGIVANIKRED